MENYFIALKPEKDLYDRIIEQKQIVGSIAGNQTYLSDSPHLTLFLFKSENILRIIDKLSEISLKIKKIPVNIKGFHVFYDDLQTNGNTLAYCFNNPTVKRLKDIQLQVIGLSRGSGLTNFFSVDDPMFSKASKEEKENIGRYGFPFVGKNWIPHMTLASINKENFYPAYECLSRRELKGDFHLDSLCLYWTKGCGLIKSFDLL
jgi:2'-5' RNA ligase